MTLDGKFLNAAKIPHNLGEAGISKGEYNMATDYFVMTLTINTIPGSKETAANNSHSYENIFRERGTNDQVNSMHGPAQEIAETTISRQGFASLIPDTTCTDMASNQQTFVDYLPLAVFIIAGALQITALSFIATWILAFIGVAMEPAIAALVYAGIASCFAVIGVLAGVLTNVVSYSSCMDRTVSQKVTGKRIITS